MNEEMGVANDTEQQTPDDTQEVVFVPTKPLRMSETEHDDILRCLNCGRTDIAEEFRVPIKKVSPLDPQNYAKYGQCRVCKSRAIGFYDGEPDYAEVEQ